jgi:hypothetical protein
MVIRVLKVFESVSGIVIKFVLFFINLSNLSSCNSNLNFYLIRLIAIGEFISNEEFFNIIKFLLFPKHELHPCDIWRLYNELKIIFPIVVVNPAYFIL